MRHLGGTIPLNIAHRALVDIVASLQLFFYCWRQAVWLALDSRTTCSPLVIETEGPQSACPSMPTGEKFLVYHPHSGFHNQRIALENAITLSYLLNRTLIMPPIRLGKPIGYGNFLHNHLQLSDKVGLEHCARLSPDSSLPLECYDYFRYTHLPWSWLVDFASIQKHHRVLIQSNHTDQWIYGCLGIAQSDVLTLKESSRYQYRFSDVPNAPSDPSGKYTENISISKLRPAQESLLHLGTLFGTSRLLLMNKENVFIRQRVRQSMTFVNPLLIELSRSIAEHLGEYFIGVHIRLGDGNFVKSGRENVRSTWWTVVHKALNFTVNETAGLEGTEQQVPSFAPYTINENPPPPFNAPRLQCHNRLHADPQLNPLNTPLYLATDVSQPRDDRSLKVFFRTFPCAFTLVDMVDHLASLDDLVNDVDGMKLKPFLSPFVDAMVLGRAWNVIGTMSSTFSAFALEVLWPSFHGLANAERE
ncbi:hypothetical protein L218DRAFT_892258 [Marasmius fiardii PR-910]|nr:hypothetical protein L218DRAFT_892258 [Marasmius fiardii PR-910]